MSDDGFPEKKKKTRGENILRSNIPGNSASKREKVRWWKGKKKVRDKHLCDYEERGGGMIRLKKRELREWEWKLSDKIYFYFISSGGKIGQFLKTEKKKKLFLNLLSEN